MTSAPSPALEAARALLRARFGYPDFRPAQVGALEAVLGGQDALIVLPTGGGKSLCYQVPALLRDGLTLVLSPLISLMKDQVEALERRGLPAAYINSTLSGGEVADRLAEVEAGRVRLLYLAPERVEGGRLLRRLQEVGVTMLAVDEAHCISEWGHDFRPSYRRIGTMRDQLGGPQTVALTATATPDVREDIVRQLALRSPRVVVAGFDRTNLTYHVAPTRTQQAKDEAAVAWLREAEGPAIVYAPTRKAVERVAGALNRRRLRSVAYHAGLDEASRQRAQDAFMRAQVRVMVATSAFGMGIDKANVRLVVHHAMPGSLEAYYQEAGRAGRDGHPSTCVLLHSYPDRFTHEFFIGAAHPERRVVEQLWRLLVGRADASGLVTDRLQELTGALPREVGGRKVEAALRLLQGAGVCAPEAPAPGRVWVRLLAAPARITRARPGAAPGPVARRGSATGDRCVTRSGRLAPDFRRVIRGDPHAGATRRWTVRDLVPPGRRLEAPGGTRTGGGRAGGLGRARAPSTGRPAPARRDAGLCANSLLPSRVPAALFRGSGGARGVCRMRPVPGQRRRGPGARRPPAPASGARVARPPLRLRHGRQLLLLRAAPRRARHGARLCARPGGPRRGPA
jgi:ATP-dependent DNA helicase RecQ